MQVIQILRRTLDLSTELRIGHIRPRRDRILQEVCNAPPSARHRTEREGGRGELTVEAGEVRDAEPVRDDLAPAIRPEMLREHRGGAEHPRTRALHDRVREHFRERLALPEGLPQACTEEAISSNEMKEEHPVERPYSPNRCRSIPSPFPARRALATCVSTARANSLPRSSTRTPGSSILSTHASASALTTRTASVRPFKNRRAAAASYVPPARRSPRVRSRRAYASWTSSCAHESGETRNALIAAFP